MPGAIRAAGSTAPPWRTTIFRGAPSGADAVRLRRFLVPPAEVPLAEPAPIFFLAALSGAFCSAAGGVSAGTCSEGALSVRDFSAGVGGAGTCCAGVFSAGAAGVAGVCPAEFAEPAASCCHEAIPAAGKLSQSAIASPQVSRITVTKRLFPTCAKNARVGAAKDSPTRKTGKAFPLPRLMFRFQFSFTRCCPLQRWR
jgi:hypothetical protein